MTRVPTSSRYQRLVERWVDLSAWPTAKKTVLAMAVAAVFHSVAALVGWAIFAAAPDVVDAGGFMRANVVWIGVVLALLLVALVPARRGREGRWTVYVVIVAYGSCVAWIITLFGVGNSPWFAIAPLIVLLVPMYWDLRAGRVALLYLMIALPTASLLELTGRIPFAPLMLQRTIDAQRTPGWHLATYFYVLAVLGYTFLMVHFSVSVRDHQQRRLEETRRELEAASRHKSEFLANMSHELRTPLNAVIGFTEVLQQRTFGPLNPKQAEYLDDVLASGRHLLSLINDILDLSKIEAGRMALEPSTFDLASAIESAIVLTRERAIQRGLRIERRFGHELGAIDADERKVKQVLINLLANAIKFTSGGGTITVHGRRDGDTVTLAVEDTGIGIAPDHQALIFTEFWQVGGDYTRKHEGTGLGLALVKRFVELHGGRVWVESRVGRGSTFALTLPLRPPTPAAAVAV